MAATYNTRSTRTTMATQNRHYCIVLTNNPRMLQAVQRMLQTVAPNVATEPSQQQQQPLPEVQIHNLPVPAQKRTRRRAAAEKQVEQQVPLQTTTIIASNMRTYEKEIEEDFQAQVQPIRQLYLHKTQRPTPINSVFDMTTYVQL